RCRRWAVPSTAGRRRTTASSAGRTRCGSGRAGRGPARCSRRCPRSCAPTSSPSTRPGCARPTPPRSTARPCRSGGSSPSHGGSEPAGGRQGGAGGRLRTPPGRSAAAPALGALAGNPGSHLGAALQAHLRQQRGDVVLHRLLRDPQPLPDLPVRQAVADEVEHAPLGGGEVGGGVVVVGTPPGDGAL